MLSNYQKQIKLHQQNQSKRKSQLQNLILVNNRITLDNASLKKELENFRSHKIELLGDFNRLKNFYQQLCIKHDKLKQEDEYLHSEIAKHRITIQGQLKDIENLRQDQKEWVHKNSQLEFTVKALKHNSKKLQLSLLEQTINDRTQIIYEKEADNSIYSNQQELRERIQSLQSAMEKHTKSVSLSSKGSNATANSNFNNKYQRFKRYFTDIKLKIMKMVLNDDGISSGPKELKLIMVQIVSFLDKQFKT